MLDKVITLSFQHFAFVPLPLYILTTSPCCHCFDIVFVSLFLFWLSFYVLLVGWLFLVLCVFLLLLLILYRFVVLAYPFHSRVEIFPRGFVAFGPFLPYWVSLGDLWWCVWLIVSVIVLWSSSGFPLRELGFPSRQLSGL